MFTKGLTLVEVLMALFIVVVAISALVYIYPGILKGARLDAQSLKAWEAAKQEMELLKGDFKARLDDTALAQPRTFNTTVANMTGFYYVARMLDSNSTQLNDLLRLEVLVCFKSGARIVGEDTNLNGVFTPGEDANGNGRIDSTVDLVTLLYSSP